MKLDFIEIGTSDFGTLIETCDDSQFGISIEPIIEYLDSLPNKPNVLKLNCAISNVDSEVDVFYVDKNDIGMYGLPSWLRGCNSILKPHESTVNVLKERNLEHLMTSKKCQAITWDTLISTYNIESVEYLKIDTEGHDCYIIRNIINSQTNVRPKKILFENNILTERNFYLETLDILSKNGYKIIESSGEDAIVERNED